MRPYRQARLLPV
jgi:hypothetical protein